MEIISIYNLKGENYEKIYALLIALSLIMTSVPCFALSKIGLQGTEVRNIQTRLKAWGYYSYTVDGIYGWRTAEAVKKFQRKHGLVVDGIAGPRTLEKIGLPTGETSSYNNDLNLLARIING